MTTLNRRAGRKGGKRLGEAVLFVMWLFVPLNDAGTFTTARL